MKKKKMDVYFSVFMHLRYYGDDASLLTELKSAKEDWRGHLIGQDNDATKTLMDIPKNVACNT